MMLDDAMTQSRMVELQGVGFRLADEIFETMAKDERPLYEGGSVVMCIAASFVEEASHQSGVDLKSLLLNLFEGIEEGAKTLREAREGSTHEH